MKHRCKNIDFDFNKIKLIALDLDGTTLTRSGLTRRTKETLEEAIRRGIQVVVATGRPYVALPERVLSIEGLKYIITSNGAHIVNKQGEFLYSNYADRDAILKACDIMEKTDIPVEVFTGGAAYVDYELYEDLKANGSTFMSAKYVLRTRKPVERIYDFWRRHGDEIENINIHFESQDERHRLWKLFEQMDGISVTSSQHNNIELVGKITSKATALRELCKMEGLSEDEIMAFGDSHNDMEMIKAAGFGVAMANGVKELKAAADFETLSNEEEGVCYAIRTLIFKEDEGVPKKKPFVDYRKLRPSNLASDEFKHLLMLIFWPLYGVAFYSLERLPIISHFNEMHCCLDDIIPFMEIFVIPYVFWYVYLFWIHIYTLLYDVKAFKKMTWFIIISFTVSVLIFMIYPTCQNLRPEVFPRDNGLSRLMGALYAVDTNTNVFPSLHVVGSIAVMYGALCVKKFRKAIYVISLVLITSIISISTAFVKQHSVLDIIGGVVVSLAIMGLMEFYYKRKENNKIRK